MELCSNEVEDGRFVLPAVFQVAFLLDDVVNGVNFGQLDQVLLFAEVGASALPLDRHLHGGWRADRGVMGSEGLETIIFFRTSVFHFNKITST